MYTYPLIAINRDGTTKLLYTREEAIKFIEIHGAWHEHHREWYSWYNWSGGYRDGEYRDYDWIVRDDYGKKVDVKDFDDHYGYYWYNKRQAELRAIGERGLPIPRTGTSRPWKMNHTAKKNSGAGHRNRNRAKAIYDAKEYGVKNDVGNRVIPWEHY